ncbi:hypothetical protein [Mycolicibacterium thermoresistibile]
MAGTENKPTRLAVGLRVRTTDDSHATGEIVEDFGDLAGTEVVVDETLTARARRWAVRLDDGTIAFLDDEGIEPID